MTKKTLAAFVAVGVCLVLVQTAGAAIVPNGLSGRFVRVNRTKPNNFATYLHVGEVRALQLGQDFALSSMGATATSVHGVGGHGNASALISTRANTDGSTWTRDDQLTSPGVYEVEALIDLGQTRSLSEIQLQQRAGCCQERLKDFTVTLEADDGFGNPGAVVASQYFPGPGNAPQTTTMTLATGRMILPGGAGVIGTDNVGRNARFIQVLNNGGVDRPLHISEIEGFAPGVVPNNLTGAATANNDIAGTSFQSQVGVGGHGSVNSVFNRSTETGGSTWTRNGIGNAYVLDLGDSQDVETVRVWQRADGCCQDRLSNFTVSLLTDDGTGNPGGVMASQSLVGAAPTNSFAPFTFANTFTIGANDTLKIEIDPMAGTADLLTVGALGDGTLVIEPGATLEITLLSGSDSGHDFNILDVGAISGTFSTVTLAPLSSGHAWITTDLYTTGVVSIVPEPVTMLALLGSLTGLGGYIRKRRKA